MASIDTSAIIGPFLTTFSPPASCLQNVYATPFYSYSYFGLGAPCGTIDPNCLPSPAPTAPPGNQIDYIAPFVYSPAFVCPTGFYTANINTIGLNTTAAVCCPS